MANVLISGGTGLVGQKLALKLIQNMHTVFILTRQKDNVIAEGIHAIYWNPETKEIDLPATLEIDTIVHLAGSNIAKGKWTIEKKKELISSRVDTANFLFETFKTHPSLHTFISASAIGYYGNRPHNIIVSEDSPSGNGFIPELCRNWEKITQKFQQNGFRTATVRIGIVMAKEGGALPAMIKPFKYGLGAALGSGKQMISWIHIDDLVDIFYCAILDKKYKGIFNGVAPNPVNNTEFSSKLALNLNHILLPFNVPSFILKAVLGEKASLILGGVNVIATNLTNIGFRFNYETIDHALLNLVNKNR